ncbi:ATP-binding protein [Streptomyces sp. ME19-01-6]|uniref:ATP-binding protein n=1 Tax=Streptomyces sp. ME19-01-6 TaxID=3028686 RepID=UPI0029BC83DC|nr:ATP-binding protein [Streptomyces sp. ME19-01-6]MDX3229352.1 ATP-binding protein [Streptomyces sp. ME19-01-6]
MDTEGTFDSRGTHRNPPPHPATPPPFPTPLPNPPAGPPPVAGPPSYPHQAPPLPPQPSAPPPMSLPATPPSPATAPPAAEPPLISWLRVPRAAAAPGVWTYGHKPKLPEDPDRIPGRRLLSGALIAALCGWLLWSLLWHGYLGNYWNWPLYLLTPDSWYQRGGNTDAGWWAQRLYIGLVWVALGVIFGRIGHWDEVWRRYMAPLFRRAWDDPGSSPAPADPQADPAQWPELRAAGAHSAADRLAEEARAGRMNDVDHVRIQRAWQIVRAGRDSLAAFTDTVLRHGAAAHGHPSGARDLPARMAEHDLVARQVRIGTAADDLRNPYRHRGVGLALDPDVLGTSLLAVGPAGAGKTGRLVRPVVEALCLQALARHVAVVAVGAAGSGLGTDEAFDVVVKIGRPDSAYDLDLYGGTNDPDEAAGVLAEALIGDMTASLPGGDSRRAATALAQLLGPYRAAHGRFPSVPELRELLDGSKAAVGALREALDAAGQSAQARELDARVRQAGAPGDVGALLADRIALLDRPVFAEFFNTGGDRRPFSLRALEHPLRVRIDLPERGHLEASRMLARLVLAQFTECAVGRADRSLFACLVLDDASHTVTPEALRGIQRLRSANAGVVLTLRTLDDVPEALRSALLGAVGCRMAYAGVTTWDGARFAEVWGTEWVEARDVTDRQIIAEEPFTKVLHFIRKVVTGKAVTTQSVTVRKVERERWSASELAHAVPAGHAVLSVTSVRGESGPPVLVDLRA